MNIFHLESNITGKGNYDHEFHLLRETEKLNVSATSMSLNLSHLLTINPDV